MNGGIRAQNLIFERVPDGCFDGKLMLTNLNSGATHPADQTILQNLWETWAQGIEKKIDHRGASDINFTRQVGVMDLDLDRLTMTKRLAISGQAICLAVQVTAGVVLCVMKANAEPLIILLITLCGQLLLIAAVTPRSSTWTKVVRGHRRSAVMLHKGLDTSKVLIIPRATIQSREISLEEFCWSPEINARASDKIRAAAAGLAFVILVVSILMTGWMEPQGKLVYLITGSLGLLGNMFDAASHPNWSNELKLAFSGSVRCSPEESSLMACVGVLIAGQFPSAVEAAKKLYPNNARFSDSLRLLENQCDLLLCESCRRVIREGHTARKTYACSQQLRARTSQGCCASIVGREAQACESKQLSDALATVSSLLITFEGTKPQPINTAYKTLFGAKHKYW
ncbi:MAG: hypothetical protein Q9160_004069 [Pyrenula sp. 1 TL-2023]